MIGGFTIALLTSGDPYAIESPYPPPAAQTISTARAAESECHIDLYNGSDNPPSTGVRDIERSLVDGGPKAVVAFSVSTSSWKWLQRLDSAPWLHLPGCDIMEMTRQGVARLIAAGVSDIAIFSTFPVNMPRTDELEGARKAFVGAGLPPPPASILIRPGQCERDGYEAAKALLSNPKRRPKGLLINHDVLTRGVLIAILELGIKVPRGPRPRHTREQRRRDRLPLPSGKTALRSGRGGRQHHGAVIERQAGERREQNSQKIHHGNSSI